MKFDANLVKVGELSLIQFKGWGSCLWNFHGMICIFTNKPHGFGRAVDSDNDRFFDG